MVLLRAMVWIPNDTVYRHTSAISAAARNFSEKGREISCEVCCNCTKEVPPRNSR